MHSKYNHHRRLLRVKKLGVETLDHGLGLVRIEGLLRQAIMLTVNFKCNSNVFHI